jgi:D-alanyl-D-alanine carboxypeptidase
MRKSRSVKKTASARRFSGKSRLAILATAVAALALAIVSLTAGTSVSAQSAQGKAKKFKATRAFVVDKQSGEVRLPTQEEVDQVVQELTTFGQKPAESVAPTTQADGTIVIDFGTGSGGVVLARPNGDGTFETRCVFTLEEGAAFLGLVEDNSAQ